MSKLLKPKTGAGKRAASAPSKEIVLLAGTILKFTQRFPTGWGVGLMQHDGKWLSLAGTFPSWVVVGTHAAFTGRFVQHAKFGLQEELDLASLVQDDDVDAQVQRALQAWGSL